MALSKTLPIKPILALVVVVAFGIYLAPPAPPVLHRADRKPVIFWHMWTAEWQPVVENICRRYNESQSVYEVIPLCVPPDGAETKFLLSASGGNPPDLVSQWNPVVGNWVDRGMIRPVEELMTPAEKARYLREAYPIMRKHSVYRGKITSIIAGVDVSAVYYRLDHLREVGVDKDHLPTTLEDLVELGKKLDRFDSSGRLKRVGYLPTAWVNYVPSFGGKFNDNGKVILDSPEEIQALEFIVNTNKRLGFDRITRFLASQAADTGVNMPLAAGNYSILLDGQWRVKQAKQFAPNLEYTIAPLPPPKGGKPHASFTGANYMLIPRQAKNPEGAFSFLKYWVGMDDSEAGGQNVADMGWLPYCHRIAETNTYRAYLKKYPQFKTFVDLASSENLETPPVGPMQSFIMNEIQKADDTATRGTLSPRAAIAQLVRNVNEEKERQRRLGNVR